MTTHSPKLKPEEEKARKEAIENWVACNGKKSFEYAGKPKEVKTWEREKAKNRASNRKKTLQDSGHADDTVLGKLVARENLKSKKEGGK